ncbi:MAG: transporter substrate-binding domain-containing protein [Burkholderiales bacterium]|nr:transporter substrate-binding domain-containing protein [Burkholderiales bacterium]
MYAQLEALIRRLTILTSLGFGRFALVLISFVLLGVISPQMSYAREVVKVYTYHLKLPLVIDEVAHTGMYFDVLRYFNQHQSDYQYELHYLPRRRLDALVNDGKLDGLVIGVSPLWFGDVNESKYAWTKSFVHDTDEVISLRETAFEFTDPESLLGKKVGLVFGYYYRGVSELAQAGKLKRDDASSEDHHFRKLLAQRIDVAIISRSNYEYVMKIQPEWAARFHVSKIPHDQFERRILLPQHLSKLQHDLNKLIEKMHHDPAWRQQMQTYRTN